MRKKKYHESLEGLSMTEVFNRNICHVHLLPLSNGFAEPDWGIGSSFYDLCVEFPNNGLKQHLGCCIDPSIKKIPVKVCKTCQEGFKKACVDRSL